MTGMSISKDFPRRSAIIICLCCFHLSITSGSSHAQQKNVDLFGYFEPQIATFSVNGEMLQLTSNKLRLDIAANLSERVSFAANYDYISYHGSTTYYYLDYLAGSVTSALPPESRDVYVLQFEDDNFLDNAYLKIAFDSFDLTLGKQQVSPGTGYAWNPTDVFNVKNVLDPTYEQPGHNAARVDIPFGLDKNLVLLYSPEADFKHSGKFVRFKWQAGHFDFSLIGGERYWPRSDYYTLDFSEERRHIGGIDIAGDLGSVGVWAEAAYNDLEYSKDYFEGVFGMDYTFDNGYYMLYEYYRNEHGKSDYREYDLNDWMRSFSTETRALTRDQVFAYFSYPATDLLTIGGSLITSLNDGSAVVVPSIIYNYEENLDITLFGNFYVGSEGNTFSSKLGTGGLLRARYYF